MEDRIRELTRKLADMYREKTQEFFVQNIKNEELISDLLNILIGAHFTNLRNCMERISQDDIKIKLKIFYFFDGLERFLSSQDMNVEKYTIN